MKAVPLCTLRAVCCNHFRETSLGQFRDVKHFQGEIYVTASTNHKVLVFSATNGELLRSLGDSGMVWCNGVAIAPDGDVLVTEGDPEHRISVWSPTGKRICVWGGNKEMFDYPFHLVILPDGQVAVVCSAMRTLSNGTFKYVSDTKKNFFGGESRGSVACSRWETLGSVEAKSKL